MALSLSRMQLRELLQRRLEEMRDGSPSSEKIAFILLDLDRFRALQNLCGPTGIDALLEIVAQQRLGALAGMRCSHLNAGRFACLVPYADQDALSAIIDRLRTSIAAPIWIDRHIINLTASMGLVVPDDLEGTADALLHAGALALGEAQKAGDGSVCRYLPSMLAEVEARATLEGEFRRGLIYGEIVPFYQPVRCLQTGILVGFEALARWQHPRLGILGPDKFLSLAEDAHLEADLLFAMLRSLCRDARTWPDTISVSFNLSPAQLCDAQIGRQILRTIYASGVSPKRLIVEITEEKLIDDVVGARNNTQLFRDAGIRIALDDFGSGYASLERLCNFDIDMLKIDRSLIRRIDTPPGRKLVQAITELGRGLSMLVAAEGLETEAQEQIARELNCTFGQGYIYSPAVSIDATYALIDAWSE